MFFQQAYGGTRITSLFQSRIDSMLGNLGAPLKVGGGLEDEEMKSLQVEQFGEHSAENGVDPPSASLEGAVSEREAATEGVTPDFRSEP